MRATAQPARKLRVGGFGSVALGALLLGCGEDDMNSQPRYNPLAASPLFGDDRSARPQVPGTVDRAADLDPVLTTGLLSGRFTDTLPIPLSRELLERGQQRFDIYCAPCHSVLGDGDGMIVRRGYKRPASFHEERLLEAPLGHFFDVITRGYASMPRFSPQLTPRDRWAIAAYIRVLQSSQRGSLDDVPPALRAGLAAEGEKP
jgi:mono/diheme cytochrome c family protein